MPYKAPVTRVTYTPRTPTNKASVGCSCTGCLLSILSFIALLWIMFHLSEIAQFITG